MRFRSGSLRRDRGDRLSRFRQVRGRPERQLRSGRRGRRLRGICSCIQNVACDANSKFDSSPSVCACVPVKPPVCGPVCDIYCQYGNVLDANGCPTCQCNAGSLRDGEVRGGHALRHGQMCLRRRLLRRVRRHALPGHRQVRGQSERQLRSRHRRGRLRGDCSCIQNVLCVQGSSFDSSPSVCACVPVSPGTCPPEKCPTPGPKTVSTICADGSIAGPVCALGANNVCGWTITQCPTRPPRPERRFARRRGPEKPIWLRGFG